MVSEDDIVEALHANKRFADMTDFTEFGNRRDALFMVRWSADHAWQMAACDFNTKSATTWNFKVRASGRRLDKSA